MISGGVLLGFTGTGVGVPAAMQFPRAARPAMDTVLPVTFPAPCRQDSQLNPRERVQGRQEACDCTSPLWLSAPPAKGQTRRPLRAVGTGHAGAPGLGSQGAVSPWGQEPCGSQSWLPPQRQAAGGAPPSRCRAQRTFHWVQGSVTMATAGGGSRAHPNSEEHMGEGRTREGAPSSPGGGTQRLPLPLPPSFLFSSSEVSLLVFSPFSRSSTPPNPGS